ncbi:hypothetical protein [Leptospira brenneri]|nr:hypothetical protein [Leptospira brenneri]
MIHWNLQNSKIAAITARQTTYVELNLGKPFHQKTTGFSSHEI